MSLCPLVALALRGAPLGQRALLGYRQRCPAGDRVNRPSLELAGRTICLLAPAKLLRSGFLRDLSRRTFRRDYLTEGGETFSLLGLNPKTLKLISRWWANPYRLPIHERRKILLCWLVELTSISARYPSLTRKPAPGIKPEGAQVNPGGSLGSGSEFAGRTSDAKSMLRTATADGVSRVYP